MQIEIGGQIIEFPEGMSEEELIAAAREIYAQQQQEQAQPADGQRMRSLGMGVMDPIYGTSQLLERSLPQGAVDRVNQAGEWLADRVPGISPPHPEGVTGQLRDREAEYQAGRAGEGFDGYRLGGNVVSGLPLAAAVPPGVSLGARMGIGGGMGAAGGAMQPALSEDYWGEKGLQAGIGAGAGAATPAVAGGAARIINPKAASSPDVAMLRKEGIHPTAAQVAGGTPKAIEEALRSTPLLGHAITHQQGRALREFNTSAINRAVAPVGGKVNGFGQSGVAQAHRVLDDAYDAARAQLHGPVLVTNNMRAELAGLRQQADTLTDSMKNRFLNELDKGIGTRMQAMSIGPEDYKVVDSRLGQLAREYGKSQDPTQRELADLFAGLRTTLREGLESQNPEAAALFRQADIGWANLRVVEDAAARAANNAGVFTPGQLTMSVRAADSSVSRSATARGQANMQDLATAGQNVLGNRVPDSGTAMRSMLGAGGVGYGIADPAGALKMGAGLGALAGGYMGLNPLARAAISHRPPGAGLLEEIMRHSGGHLSTPGVGMGAAGLLGE